jgi:cold shock CspA family protein
MRTQGSLVKWNEDRGFGFIKTGDSGTEIFAHISGFPRGARRPQIGDALSFEIVSDKDGRKQAKAIAFDALHGRADFTLAQIDRPPVERASRATHARSSTPRSDRHRRASRGRSLGGLQTLFFGALLFGALFFGYRKFLEYRAVAVDNLYGRSTEAAAAPSSTATPTPTAEPAYRCDGRTHCSQMRSCADATAVLRHCPGTQMDGDGDGIPCEPQWCF